MIILELLREIRGDLRLAWLKPYETFFARQGLALPSWENAEALDLDQVGQILSRPPGDLPEPLGRSLFFISDLATPAGLDLMLTASAGRQLARGAGDAATPADLAVQLWLHDPDQLERLQVCHEVSRSRAFCYFSTDANPVPAFDGASPAQIAALEQRLGRFHMAWKRGRGTHVFPCLVDRQWWFLVRHGAPWRRAGAMDDGRPATISYRPQKHDVLVYDPVRGEIGVNCCAVRERTALLRAFGSCLFGRADFFPGTAQYTLAPLVQHGRDSLACADVPGLERVTLTEVEFYFRDRPWKRVTHKADDIFRLVDAAELEWPDRLEHLARATFEVRFRRAARPRLLTIVPSNKTLYGRDSDSPLLQQWMQARRFLDSKQDN